MRLIGFTNNEKDAYTVCNALKQEGIAASYDFEKNKEGAGNFRIWVVNEEDIDQGQEILNRYQENPSAPEFQFDPQAFTLPKPPEEIIETEQLKTAPPLKGWKIKIALKPRKATKRVTFTQIIMLICIAIFMWNDLQETQIVREKGELVLDLGLTPIQRTLMFDEPAQMDALAAVANRYNLKGIHEEKEIPIDAQKAIKDAEAIPYWQGFYEKFFNTSKKLPPAPLFEKIRQGEIWRLFTPCILHRDFFHILFNLLWLWYLGRQMEERLGKWRFALFALAVGIIANMAQYLMSGPYFIGLSGIVVGMVGFIWQRQRKAPWEGYPLNKPTVVFVALFVAIIALLQGLAFFLHLFTPIAFSPNIANTAHIVGGFSGIALAHLPLFQRREK